MALILNLDTSTETASICLSEKGETLSLIQNHEQKDHASWLHPAIDKLMKLKGYKMSDLSAVAVTDGPGSYTGLRVGMSTAKGFCYALNIPLITEGTLKIMAFAAVRQTTDESEILYCPMIDARRNEVFTAMYNRKLEELVMPSAMVLHENSFAKNLQQDKICFFGSGSNKWKNINSSSNAFFAEIVFNAGHLGNISYDKFRHRQFTDIIYSQPAYIKDFYSHNKK